MIEPAFADQIERLDQPLEILVRLDVAGVQHELVVKLIPLAHTHDIFLGRVDGEPLVVGVVDHVDLLRLRVDEAEDVAFRALRHGHDARRAPGREADRRPRVPEREPVRQILRKHQVNAVVDRHDGAATNERRQHIVRRVEQGHPLALERQRDSHLLGDGIVARRLGNRPEVLAERRQRLAIPGTAEDHELGPGVDPRQVPQQIPDVGADAEVVQLAGVYADPHGHMILSRSRGSGGSRGSRGSGGSGRSGESGGSARFPAIEFYRPRRSRTYSFKSSAQPGWCFS